MKRAAIVVSAVVVSCAAGPAAASPPPPPPRTVVPPGESVQGKSYAQWEAAWGKWSLQTPVHGPNGQRNPLTIGDGPGYCSYGQHGNVWFLSGRFLAAGSTATALTAHRYCTVPAGTYLFFPTIDSTNDNVAAPPSPPTTFTVAQLRAGNAETMNSVQSLFASIDGVKVPSLTTGDTPYRFQSPVFLYNLPKDNVYTFQDGTTVPAQRVPAPGAVGDGAFVLVRPLGPGQHILHFGGTTSSFSEDITYTITVACSGPTQNRRLAPEKSVTNCPG